MARLVVRDREPDPPSRAVPGGAGTGALLAAIVLIASILRFVGLDWDEGRYLHPDERFLAQVESAIDLPSSLREYLDTAASPLNPNNRGFGFFVYGTMPLATVQLLGTWLAVPGNDLDQLVFGRELGPSYGTVHLVGRALSAVCDLLTTLLTFAVSATLYGRAAGVLAAALYAMAVLPIQQAHFFTVDAVATLLTTAALWFAARAATHARWVDDMAFGITLGAALACKLSIFPAVILLGISVVLRFSAHNSLVVASDSAELVRLRRTTALAVRAALTVNIVVVAAALTFRLLQPYAFMPPYGGPAPALTSVRATQLMLNIAAPRWNASWLEQMNKARAQQTGDDDSPPNHQWATRRPFVFAWLNLVRFGMGWPLGIIAWVGWAWALAEGLRGRSKSWRHVLPVSWIGLYFAWTSAGWVASMRYFLPIYPALAIAAAWALVRIAAPDLDASAPTASVPSRRRRAIGITAIAITLIATAGWAWAFTRIYTRPHTRVAASRWIFEQVPSAVTLILDSDSGRFEQAINMPTSSPEAVADSSMPRPRAITAGPEMAAVAKFQIGRSARVVGVRFHQLNLRDVPPDPRTLVTATIAETDGTVLGRCAVRPFDAGESQVRHVECHLDAVPLILERDYELRIDTRSVIEMAGAAIANEGVWDDALPLVWPGHDPDGRFATYALDVVYEDDEAKRRRLQFVLDHADYVVISSNRFYKSLARNPRRWPMTLDYYRALFTGTLGFVLAADFTSPPTLGPLRIDDQKAEEAFTVYDHPRVLIFRKTSNYDSVRTAAVLGQANLASVVRQRAALIDDQPLDLPLP